MTEPTAAGGGCRKAEEGKVTSDQEGIYAVAECDDNFSGEPQVRFPFVFTHKKQKTDNRSYLFFWSG